MKLLDRIIELTRNENQSNSKKEICKQDRISAALTEQEILDAITKPDKEGISGNGNQSGTPRSPETAVGDFWTDYEEIDDENEEK